MRYFREAIDRNDFSKPVATFSKSVRRKYLDYFGASTYLDGIFLKYHYSDEVWISIALDENNKYVSVEYSEEFKERLKAIVKRVVLK